MVLLSKDANGMANSVDSILGYTMISVGFAPVKRRNAFRKVMMMCMQRHANVSKQVIACVRRNATFITFRDTVCVGFAPAKRWNAKSCYNYGITPEKCKRNGKQYRQYSGL